MENSAIGSNWKDVRSQLFTKEEILESDMRVTIMSELIEARHEQGISQKKLEELSGVSQPVIARMETGKTSPTVGYGIESFSQFRKDISSRPTRIGKELIRVDSYSMKTKEQTRKLAVGCSKHCFEVVDKTDEVSNHMSKARRR
ncbi:toxin-antitoxin system, antitoxin component, Xre family [Streptococcus pneumoniae]|nr:toxin-antitoxin system, antitoxin component, Xre family [Streptococcus pneumoniae]VLE58089.1 toxin-antitoxin system, antitoxin component, Xre family [Streptococcus pneumoniae]VLM10562.1 toxin-antitoxin system, antitoxin component, Xre family [Streptococcus pneumoniae]VNX07627.1 toxin-antitoxin system, antitoxin component, Xre family [Streptococcus pneumoniae]VOC84399.1 toxin-antitoxin system, antitoxin component, Xre family [Streptococcus pneumoniae]